MKCPFDDLSPYPVGVRPLEARGGGVTSNRTKDKRCKGGFRSSTPPTGAGVVGSKRTPPERGLASWEPKLIRPLGSRVENYSFNSRGSMSFQMPESADANRGPPSQILNMLISRGASPSDNLFWAGRKGRKDIDLAWWTSSWWASCRCLLSGSPWSRRFCKS